MERMQLNVVPRVRTIAKRDFVQNYLRPQRPLIIEGLSRTWPAYRKWSLDYIREIAGDREVPVFDDRPISSSYRVNQPHEYMRMSRYIQLLQQGPTSYRIFLYHLLKEVPELQRDFSYPDIGLRLLRQIPMLFFGGEGATVFMHYDIDLANILHFHFEGKKRCILFPPDQTRYLYKVPHSLIALEDIDFLNPDYSRYPALKKARGFVAELQHGDTLYMPEGYWHQMTYLTAGFSMSLRAAPRHLPNLGKALYNLFWMRHFDNAMRKFRGQEWIARKNELAIRRTHRKNSMM